MAAPNFEPDAETHPPPLRGGRARGWWIAAFLAAAFLSWLVTVFNSSDYCKSTAPSVLCSNLHGEPSKIIDVSPPIPPAPPNDPVQPKAGWVAVAQTLQTQPAIDLSRVNSIEETAEWHWFLWGLALLPFALTVTLSIRYWRRRSDVLQRSQGDDGENLQRDALRLAEPGALFDAVDADTAMRALNQPVPVTSARGELDTLESLRETARHGTPRLVHSLTSRLPEVVLLVQIASAGDLRRELADRLTVRLTRNGLRVRAYLFSAQPTWLVPLGQQQGMRMSPSALRERHPHARILLLCEPARAYDLYASRLLDWAATLADWQAPLSILTLEPFDVSLSQQLRQDGLQLLPLDAAGLELLTVSNRDSNNHVQPLPPHLYDGDWPADGALASRRYEQLSEFMGEPGMRLLKVLALYPELHLGLAVALDRRLFPTGDRSARQQRLFRLLRLPWARHGWLPDTLRLTLIDSQGPVERREASELYRNLFESLGASGELRLPFALPDKWTALRLFLGLRGPGQRDLLFLSQVVGPRWLNKLAFYLPKAGRRLAQFGRHFLLLATALLLLSSLPVLWLAMNPPTVTGTGPLKVTLLHTAEGEAEMARLSDWFENSGAEVSIELAAEPLPPGTGLRVKPEKDNIARQVVEYLRRVPSPTATRVLLDDNLLDDLIIEIGAPIEQPITVYRDHEEDTSRKTDDEVDDPLAIRMVAIPAGEFVMGSSTDNVDEVPERTVTIKAFEMSETEVTFDQYDAFVSDTGRNLPSDQGFGRGSRPVISVSWDDANAYIVWLNEKTGDNFRLPTEAEWEYAARAGTTTAYWWGDDIGRNRANCDGCGSEWDGKSTAPVASFSANSFGLFDTAGNVWEWVEDCWHGNYDGAPVDGTAWLESDAGDCDRRVLRGGGWVDRPVYLRAANRDWSSRVDANLVVGFRLARTR